MSATISQPLLNKNSNSLVYARVDIAFTASVLNSIYYHSVLSLCLRPLKIPPVSAIEGIYKTKAI